MIDLSEKDVNIRQITTAKDISSTNGNFIKYPVDSDFEKYIRTLLYPDPSQSSKLKTVEYDSGRSYFYKREANRLNYFENSYIDDLSNFFNTSSITVTQSVADPYGGTNAITINNTIANATVYDTLSDRTYYISGWFKSDGDNIFKVGDTELSSSANWEYKTFSVYLSDTTEVPFSSSSELSVYQPRIFNQDHNLYVETYENNSSVLMRSDIYAMTSSLEKDVNGINRNSFQMNLEEQYYFTDDGEGNLIHNGDKVGNVFYDHAIVTFDENYYLSGSTRTLDHLELSSSFVDYSYQTDVDMVKTTITILVESDAYNYSFNPTYSSNKDPYITSIWLLNEADELIMTANLSKPISTRHDIFFVLEMLELL